MNINLTLLGQTITFAIFVLFCMKYIWPPLMRVLDERKRQIADGLAAAEKGKRDLELAQKHALEVLKKAKQEAQEIITHAEKRASEVAEEAKVQARTEAERILHAARTDIDQELNRAKEQLRASMAELACAGAGKILEKEIDAKTHAKLFDAVVKQL